MDLVIIATLALLTGMRLGSLIKEYQMTQAFRKILNDLNISEEQIRGLTKKIIEEQEQDIVAAPQQSHIEYPRDHVVEVKMEKHGDQFYAYRKDTDQFLAQGTDQEQILAQLNLSDPSKRFVAR